jgi:hypothetical protein
VTFAPVTVLPVNIREEAADATTVGADGVLIVFVAPAP